MLYGCISSTLEEKPILTGIKLLPADKTKTQPISPHPFSESCSHMTKSHDFSVTWQKSYGKPLVLTPEWFSVADPGISRFTRSHPKDRPFIYYSRLLRHVRVPRSHCVLTRIPWGSHYLSYTATRDRVCSPDETSKTEAPCHDRTGKIFLPEKRMQSNDLYLQQLALVILYVGVEIMFYLTQCMHTRIHRTSQFLWNVYCFHKIIVRYVRR